jgi:hypothetical protein
MPDICGLPSAGCEETRRGEAKPGDLDRLEGGNYPF